VSANGFPPFEPRAPWWGADLQTLRNKLRPPRADGAQAERIELPLGDGTGDVLVGFVDPPEADAERALVVLIHGLGGSSESEYIQTSARWLRARGHAVLRLNLRGAGASRPLCRLQYHAGRTGDLAAAIAALPPRLTARGIGLVGFSLGGNLVLKFLAEHGRSAPLVGAVSISAPIDLHATALRMLDRRNWIYQRYLLRGMRSEAIARGSALTAEERAAVLGAKSVLEFDDRFVAPRNGYSGAQAYYAANMARRFLADVPLPALVISAQDDPWIPAEPYTSYPWRRNPRLVPLLPRRGGHVGFHGRGSRVPWHDRCTAQFFAALDGDKEDFS
jgi:hypothetical protein